MISELVLYLQLVFFAFPTPQVNWAVADKLDSLNVRVQEPPDRVLELCLRDGFEIRYRYTMQVCRRRSWWLDRCEEPRVQINSLVRDPVKQVYRVTKDRLNDASDPSSDIIGDYEQAWRTLSTAEDVAWSFLSSSKGVQDLASEDAYLSVLVECSCKESSARWLAYLVSLGLADPVSFDSGWVDFEW